MATRPFLALVTAVLLGLGPVRAADAPPDQPARAAVQTAPIQAGNADMMQAMDKMNKAMATAPMTGNADHDFAAMMIPHHQGAIDMAVYELDHGKDPKMRKLAASIIKAQESEMAAMQAWLGQHPK